MSKKLKKKTQNKSKIHCECNYCGASWKIPRQRILFFEEFHEIEKGQKYVWEWFDTLRYSPRVRSMYDWSCRP